MRSLGGLLLLGGVVGFLYCSSQLSELPPIPDGTSLGDYVRYESGKFELGRYVGICAAFVGLLLALFPKGR
jgi:hypothetical protein